MNVYLVILTDHGAVDSDGIRVFESPIAALKNFLDVRDDIQSKEPGSFQYDDENMIAFSENYAVTVLKKKLEYTGFPCF